MVQAAINLTT